MISSVGRISSLGAVDTVDVDTVDMLPGHPVSRRTEAWLGPRA